MAFGVDIDTLNLLFDKLQHIFAGFDPYFQSYSEMHALYKKGMLSEKEFFERVSDAVLRYSSLGFLSIKTLFEIKKSLDKITYREEPTPSLESISNRSMTQSEPASHTVASFILAKNLPNVANLATNDHQSNKNCAFCKKFVGSSAKFCTNCGNRL